jgi:putative transposase
MCSMKASGRRRPSKSIPVCRRHGWSERYNNWQPGAACLRRFRLDNGPELTAQYFTDWCAEKGIELRHIQPGKPNQNAFIERFNRSYRTEVLNGWLFASLDEVREITHQWIISYNEERPHNALGNLPPAVYHERLLAALNSTSQLST